MAFLLIPAKLVFMNNRYLLTYHCEFTIKKNARWKNLAQKASADKCVDQSRQTSLQMFPQQKRRAEEKSPCINDLCLKKYSNSLEKKKENKH